MRKLHKGGARVATKGDELHGMIIFHFGDDSDFVARRVGKKKRVTKR
jgi:hypothetical protein